MIPAARDIFFLGEVRVANGNGRRARWFSAGTHWVDTRVLVQGYEEEGKQKTFKFPGGKEKSRFTLLDDFKEGDRDDKTPKETLIAEIGEEVFEPGTEWGVEGVRFVHERYVNANHTQYFYEIDWLKGVFRKDRKIEEEPGRPREILSAPFYMDVRELWSLIYWSHKEALRDFVLQRARRDREIDRIATKLLAA